ncbi:MAG: EAL domain-containing protein [Hyphomicrobiaceae bacterium]|nr:EAL domain-containing protein [Hyphomicrobiaceae bacterium]
MGAGRARGWLALLALLLVLVQAAPAHALKAIQVNNDLDRVEITTLGEAHDGKGDTLQIETAPGADGVTGRMSVRAQTAGTNPSWFVFALTNITDKPLERWLAADRYNTVGSGIVWPDLDARRIEAVTPSVGFVPERIKNDRADVFRLTLEPGQTVTFVAEMSSEHFTRLALWKSIEYEQKSRDRQLFNGIMLGITGLLAIFLTAVFAANHKAIFPAAAVFTWAVLAYLCVDFGFWHKLFNIKPEENAQYRAAAEAAMAACLLVFTTTFLRLSSWNSFLRMLIGLWIFAQLSLIAVAFLDPRLAATFARLSTVAIAGGGAALTLLLALAGQDRALSLIPTWTLLLVWLFGAALVYTGRLGGDVMTFGLTAGLVMIVVLIGFTVTQYAFRSIEPLYGTQPGENQVRSLAIEGAGAAVWEWLARRDEISVSPIVESILGLEPGRLSTKIDDFGKHMHPADRERFKLLLGSIKERSGGEIRIEFRLRHADNSYHWFELEAASVPTSDHRNLRCIGLMRDITDAKRAQERLMQDAVNDSLTGLPNRELFLDRLGIAAKRATLEPLVRPALLFVDIDRFKNANAAFGLVVGDSLLLTVARRLSRNLGPQDTLARVGGDQFALLLLNQSDPRELAMLAEAVRRSLRAPINIAGQDVVLTASIGISIYDGPDDDPAELLREAEIAMYRAKRGGTDRIEIFSNEMKGEKGGRPELEQDLRRAIEKRQLKLHYQPIFYLPTETLAGFEALVRWDHPQLGTLNPSDFIPIAEESELIEKLGSFVLEQAVQEAAKWQSELSRPDNPVFVSVNVSSRQLFKPDLVNEVRHILARAVLPKGSLRLEITESLAMENPEKATTVLRQLADAGAGIALDDFGTGYSSLSYLNQFTFDTIKLDRSFLAASGPDGAGSTILRSIVALSHELGKKVVAEGVETEEDVGFLRSIGCEYGQGFYYSEPMSERDVMQLLRVARKAERRIKKSLLRKRLRQSEADETVEDEEIAPPAAAPPPGPAPQPAPRPAYVNGNGAGPPVGMPGGPMQMQPPGARPAGPMPQPQPHLQRVSMPPPGMPAPPPQQHVPMRQPEPREQQRPGPVPGPQPSYVPPPLAQGQAPNGMSLPASPPEAAKVTPFSAWPVVGGEPPGPPRQGMQPPPPPQPVRSQQRPAPPMETLPASSLFPAPGPSAPPPVTTAARVMAQAQPSAQPQRPAAPPPPPPSAPPAAPAARTADAGDYQTLPSGVAESLAKLAGRRSNPPPPPDLDPLPPLPRTADGKG